MKYGSSGTRRRVGEECVLCNTDPDRLTAALPPELPKSLLGDHVPHGRLLLRAAVKGMACTPACFPVEANGTRSHASAPRLGFV